MTRFGHKLNYVIKTFVKRTPGVQGRPRKLSIYYKVSYFITLSFNIRSYNVIKFVVIVTTLDDVIN